MDTLESAMDKEEALKKSKEEEEKKIPTLKEIEEENKEFNKVDKEAYKLLKSSKIRSK